ncbi:MAG: Hsp20/alpha crystallin family protein [Ignavibacteria bacterium]|nr:Hsp20/alpha crystallin family protein [Ignavibacteria bacterium]MCC7158035.1 Hsp20/alpha crystallin family protein [Ignavibacteria bacterium]
MTLVKFKPTHELSHIEKRLRKFFEDFDSPFSGDWGVKPFGGNAFTPRVDVTEDNDNLFVHAEVPGVDKNDIKINIVGDVLTISGEKKSEQKDENKNYYRIERNYGSFSRSFTLPSEVIVDKISADYNSGVLNITLPKTEAAKIVEKQIEIK